MVVKDYSEWYARLQGKRVERNVLPAVDFLFPHPVTPRNVLSVAERAFMREVRRRVREVRPDFDGLVNIDDVSGDTEADLFYRLTLRWGWPDGSKRGDGQPPAHMVRGTGYTPGQALEAVLRELA